MRKCNMCNKKFDLWDLQESFHIYKPEIGYGSRYDGERLDLDFCCECMDKIIDACRISPVTNLGTFIPNQANN